MLSHINLDRATETPLYRQLYTNLREAILRRQLAGGTKLPASRQLAHSLGVSRNTVKIAFEQLLAEGYLEAQVGAGTFVTRQLPEGLDYTPQTAASTPRERPVSRLGHYMETWGERGLLPDTNRSIDTIFLTGIPAIDQFPFDLWTRLLGKVVRTLPENAYDYSNDIRGYPLLRQEIAHYLRRTRAVRCHPDQIVIVSGAQMGLHILGQALVNQNDEAWVEEPGYGGAHGAMLMAGAKLVPVPVDEEGMLVNNGIAQAVNGRVALVTPSHHFPLGGTMSLPRRLQLLTWAEQNSAWIIEDDYDSVFHYNRLPLPSLQGLDRAERVIYLGTFSKVIFPALRLAYLVLPTDLVPVILGCKTPYEHQVPQISQATLAQFMANGHFARHLRQMGKLYQQRRDLLLAALTEQLGDKVTIGPAQCGMHLTIRFSNGVKEAQVRQQLNLMGISANMVGDSALGQLHYQGIMLGFASASSETIKREVTALSQAIQLAEKELT